MKANEVTSKDLMVGDWLMFNGKPCQVKGLHNDDTATLTGYRSLYYLIDAEPIQLTPEILEKNGFYRREIPTRDEIGHYYHRKTAPSSIFVSMSFDDGRDFGNEIKYVHELQHLLRLCNIDFEFVV